MRPSWSNFTLAKTNDKVRSFAGRFDFRNKMLLGTVWLLFQAAFSFSGSAWAYTADVGEKPAPSEPDGRKVIMLVVDGLSVADFISPRWQNMRALAQNGAVGLMNARTATTGSLQRASAHVTVGAGTRAPAASLTAYALNAAGRSMDATGLFAPGIGPPPDSGVLVPGIAQLHRLSASLPQKPRPGHLGGMLRSRGARTAVIGNADVPDLSNPLTRFDAFGEAAEKDFIVRRHGALIAMDPAGHVGAGSVSTDLLAYDESWPFGWRTNYEEVWRHFTAAWAKSDFFVIELSDFTRLEHVSDWISDAYADALRQQVISHIDGFIGRLARWPPAENATVLLISPSPAVDAARRNFLLTPVLLSTLTSRPLSTGAQPTLVTSATTHRTGIITNTDIAPAIVALFDVGGYNGRDFRAGRIYGVPTDQLRRDLPPTVPVPDDPWQAVSLLYGRATATHALRAPVIKTFIVGAIIVFSGWILWMLYSHVAAAPAGAAIMRWWHSIMLFLSAIPLAMLVLSFFPPFEPFGASITLISLVAAIAGSAHFIGARSSRHNRRSGVVDGLIIIAAATAFALLLDVWTGARLIKSSLLGYDPIVGARFYGIGNEYMGVLIGTALVGGPGLLDRVGRPFRRRAVAAVLLSFAVICGTLAAPGLGANVGGTIAAIVGFAVTGALLLNRPLTWKGAVAVVSLLTAVLIGAAAADMLIRPERMSHLGRTLQLVLRDGWAPFGEIVVRKLHMNAKLLRWTIWAQVFLVSLAVSAFALYRPGATLRRIERTHPMLVRGVRGSIAAALVALVANDSGVVAAATMMIPVTAIIMYLVLLQRD